MKRGDIVRTVAKSSTFLIVNEMLDCTRVYDVSNFAVCSPVCHVKRDELGLITDVCYYKFRNEVHEAYVIYFAQHQRVGMLYAFEVESIDDVNKRNGVVW